MSGDMNLSLIQGLLMTRGQRQTDVYVNINQTVHPLTALLDLYFRPRLFDLLDHTAHEFIDLLQGSGGTEWAEELDALTGCQQLYSQN